MLDTGKCYRIYTDDVDFAVKIACVAFECTKANVHVVDFNRKGTVYESID